MEKDMQIGKRALLRLCKRQICKTEMEKES